MYTPFEHRIQMAALFYDAPKASRPSEDQKSSKKSALKISTDCIHPTNPRLTEEEMAKKLQGLSFYKKKYTPGSKISLGSISTSSINSFTTQDSSPAISPKPEMKKSKSSLLQMTDSNSDSDNEGMNKTSEDACDPCPNSPVNF